MDAKQLEELCGSWAGVTQAVKSEDDLVFSVAGKMFAVLCLRGPDRERLSFKVDAERFLELVEQPGVVEAHFAARAFWITLTEPERFDEERIARFVRRSCELVRAGLSKRQQAALSVLQSTVQKKNAPRKRKS